MTRSKKEEKLTWDEFCELYKGKTQVLKSMSPDELLRHVGYKFEKDKTQADAAFSDNPALDRAILNNHILNEAKS